MAKYLRGTVHWLTEEQAQAYLNSESREFAEITQDADGTFSVFLLSDKPIQHGQAEWRSN